MLKRLVLFAVMLLAGSGVALAQTGTVNGRVVDQDNAVLPGVTINVKNTETGATRSTVTNEQGVYSLPALERGQYEISTDLAGFASSTRRLELVAGSTVTADFKLGLASLSETL